MRNYQQPTRTAEAPAAPPAMNDLMDSLVDDDPVVFAGPLSTKVGSSLYTKHERGYQPIPHLPWQSANGMAYHRGGRVKVKRNCGMADRFLDKGSCDYF